MQRLFAAVIMLMLSASSAWADWQLLKETRDYILYIDPDTLEKSGNLVKAVSFQDFHKMQTLEEHSYLASKSRNEYDCANNLLRQVEFSIFPENMGSGGTLFSDNKLQNWMPVQAGSAAESLWKTVCDKN
jgi:hypothetical protein